ncbi:MAG: hypothetical protein DYH05_09300 [Acidobacteria bacterium ACB1]|nr:hypothetical protein [Acidobacteria bacterium ACB1]RIJ90195.1 MAG: hypothetical protein DCC44_10910 [Acidobacteriota bacterium]
MPNSYKKIDYRLRPAKSIERKMFADSFRRLSAFARVSSYRYVGFGSVYFSDFYLFHKLLGFEDMISIENATHPMVQQRFEFNRPYSSIRMLFGKSTDVLPKLAWEPRTIYWLDYDTTLSSEILDDIGMISAKAASGSVLIVSICIPGVGATETDEEESKGPLDSLRRSIGVERVPSGLKNKDFAGWGTAEIYRQVVNNQIEESLKNRNGILTQSSKIAYEQIYNFRYADGMRIMTLGGVLFDAGQSDVFDKCGFSTLDFTRSGSDAYLIEAPLLTFREIRTLERDLPVTTNRPNLPLSASDIDKFGKVYRYFPMFAEGEF